MIGYLKSFMAIALEDFPFVEPHDNVAQIIVATAKRNRLVIDDGDIIVVSQKIFSKAEGRIARLRDVVPSRRAEEIALVTGKDPRLVELVLRETKSMIKVSPEVLLLEDKREIVCINAGIDKSNVEGSDTFALLPEDPDTSAERCRQRIKRLTGKNVAVIVCDTYSRPFRRGQVNYGIGIAGLNPFRDYRGKEDLFGYVLKVKNVAIVDEIAAAAELLMGQAAEAMPVVIFRGLENMVEYSEGHAFQELRISREEDLFKDSL